MSWFRRRAPEPVAAEPAPPVEPAPSGRYSGPVCYVDRDQEGPDGRLLLGGWHYSTRQVTHTLHVLDESGALLYERDVTHEFPAERLHLNDAGDGPPFYEYATAEHRSWQEKHGGGEVVRVRVLPEGEAHPAEAYSDHPDHEDWHYERGSTPGIAGPREPA